MQIPQLRVQRQGKKWRIVLDATRTLAKFNSGQPLDDGGFLDEYDEEGRKTVDGQFEAQRKMQMILADLKGDPVDAEAEAIGH